MSVAPTRDDVAAPRAGTRAGRIRTIDWMRGLSVIVMVVVHAQVFLSPAHDHDPARGYFNAIGGLPAPVFILAAGFSLALVTARATNDAAKRRARARKSIIRIGQVLLGSLLLRYVMWDPFRNWQSWAWLDVLTCIALMLLVTWFVLFVLPPRRWLRFAVFGVLAVSCFAAAPWVEAPRTFGWATTLINNSRYPDTWPLIPWAGYGWLGAMVGLIVGASAAPLRAMIGAFVAIGVVGYGVSWLGPLLLRVDPSVSPWMITNAGERLWKIAVIAIVFGLIESRGNAFERHRLTRPLVVFVTLFSHQSLVAYVGHLLLLFGFRGWGPFNRFLFKMDWPMYAVLTPMLMAATAGACVAVEARRKRKAKDARSGQNARVTH